MKCPECGGKLNGTGFDCAGSTLYSCEKCKKKWKIKEDNDEDDQN